MKIALIYSGHYRSFEKTKNIHNLFIYNLRKIYDIKVFCHLWDTIESNTISWWEKNSSYNDIETISIESIYESLSPQAFEISDNNELVFSDKPAYYNGSISYEGVSSMLYSLYKSYLLYENYSNENEWIADYFIRIRYDLDFDFKSIIDCLRCNENINKIYLFKTSQYRLFETGSDVLFIINDKEIFKSYLNFIDNKNLEKYFNEYKIFIPEIFLFKFSNGSIKIKYLIGKLNIVRMNGDVVNINMKNIDSISSLLFNVRKNYFKIYNDKKKFTNDLYSLFSKYRILKFYYVYRGDFNIFHYIKVIIQLNQLKKHDDIRFELIKYLENISSKKYIDKYFMMLLKLLFKKTYTHHT